MTNLKKIGILGSGPVAKSLGNGFLRIGHTVMLGTRDKNKLIEWQKNGGVAALTGSFAETAEFGDLIVLAVAGRVATEVLNLVGEELLKGKTIIDTTNPISQAPPTDGVLHFFTDMNESLMEQLQKCCPGSNFVKAFNSVGSAHMVHPAFKGGQPSMFICGNNEHAKSEVARILDIFGWEPVDMGTATAARAIEPLCILWCIPGFMRNEWNHAFKLLR